MKFSNSYDHQLHFNKANPSNQRNSRNSKTKNNQNITKLFGKTKDTFQLNKYYTDLQKIQSSLHSNSHQKISRNSSNHSLTKPYTPINHTYKNNQSYLKKQNTFINKSKFQTNKLHLHQNIKESNIKNQEPYLNLSRQKSQNTQHQSSHSKTYNNFHKKKIFDSQNTSKYGDQNQNQNDFRQPHSMTHHQFYKKNSQNPLSSYLNNIQKSSENSDIIFQNNISKYDPHSSKMIKNGSKLLKSQMIDYHQETYNVQQSKYQNKQKQNQKCLKLHSFIAKQEKKNDLICQVLMSVLDVRDRVYDKVTQGMNKIYEKSKYNTKFNQKHYNNMQLFENKDGLSQQQEIQCLFEREKMLCRIVEQFKRLHCLENYNLKQLYEHLFERKSYTYKKIYMMNNSKDNNSLQDKEQNNQNKIQKQQYED